MPTPTAPAELTDNDQANRPAARLRQRRQQRLQMLGMVLASYAVDSLLLGTLAAIGVVDSLVPWAYAGAGLAVCALFYTLLSGQWSEGRAEPYLVIPQMLVNAAINLAFIAWVPQVGGPMLMLLFVIFAFGSLRMSLPTVLQCSLLISALVGVEIALVGDRLALPLATTPERIVSGLWFALILSRSALLGLYGSILRELLAKRNAQLADTFSKLEHLASRDPLTGALNRRSVMNLLEDEIDRAQRTRQAFGVALLDLDHFKRVNDTHGHLVGDEVLRRLVTKVGAEMRGTDRLGRFGGEEFLLVLTAAKDLEAATAAAERVRTAVAGHAWGDLAPGLSLSLSAGVTLCREGDSIEQLLGRADRALYRAKREGRDRVRVA